MRNWYADSLLVNSAIICMLDKNPCDMPNVTSHMTWKEICGTNRIIIIIQEMVKKAINLYQMYRSKYMIRCSSAYILQIFK